MNARIVSTFVRRCAPALILASGLSGSLPAAEPASVVIGKLEWATHNLDVGHFANGEPIPEARTSGEWIKAWREGKPAWCYYNNDPANGGKFGRIYNLPAVKDRRGLAPPGWRIATTQDFNALTSAAGAGGGRKLKSREGWNENGGGTDELGFGARPGGSRYSNGGFYGLGDYAVFGTAAGANVYFAQLGTVRGGSDRGFGKNGLYLRLVRPAPEGMQILPGNPPNPGILFVNNEATGRSGHNAHAIVECHNGDILAFYANTSGIIHGGHTGSGWSEYKRSTDGGRTWSEPIVFEYSKKVWQGNQEIGGGSYSNSLVCSAVAAPNGTVIAFLANWWFRKSPVYFLSRDHGRTWEGPRPLDPEATGDEAGRVHGRSVFVHEGAVYIVTIGGRFTGPLSLYASTDNGETFTRRAEDIFANRMHRKHAFYQTASVLPDGSFIVYSYQGGDDEQHAPYVISRDKGYTWSEARYAFMEKKIRNPQMSERIGDYYFMHGRTGNRGYDTGKFVLYQSRDGINWDSGIFLNRGEGVASAGSDAYSGNAVVGRYTPGGPLRLLIQSSISYADSRVNVKHWWVENIPGAARGTGSKIAEAK